MFFILACPLSGHIWRASFTSPSSANSAGRRGVFSHCLTGCIYTMYVVRGSRNKRLLVVALWLGRPVKQVISRNVTFSFVGMSAPSGTSPEGPGIPVFSDAAMANPGALPISDTPFSIDISTPTGSDKSRSLRDRRHLPHLSNAIVPSHAGFNHRGYLDLHLALFSAHSSFHLDLRSF